ncbi:hypothetical protein Mgra_00001192 [Meloidogyne graminicola]|uniref:RUN domain-containing protein n=1 Tax=Meloidogyne graminicola TaxID=189291 RepID=A0A8S9ZZT2_9BILA|nr:hypothetical protein Mgra_00001192 [Meloidogyne graminicola]
MVDLYDIKLLPTTVKDNDTTTYWPPNIDERVANLDFGTSMTEDGNNMSTLFSDSIGADPRLISTDSLDIEMIRMRCENNKQNDYKLTFEDDSGQWTTSGIGASYITNASASPTALQTRKVLKFLREKEVRHVRDGNSLLVGDNHDNHPSLQLLERLNLAYDNDDLTRRGEDNRINNEKLRDKLMGEIFNNDKDSINCSKTHHDLIRKKPSIITWGRINAATEESTEQISSRTAFDSDNVTSLSGLNCNRRICRGKFEKPNCARGVSSPAFVCAQSSKVLHQTIDNVEADDLQRKYSEYYIGNGRYIDMNHNEIGFTPTNTIVHAGPPSEKFIKENESVKNKQQHKANTTTETFADLSPSKTAPDLQFIALSYKVPSICTNSSTVAATTSFDDLLKQAKEGNLESVLEYYPAEKLLFENGKDECNEDTVPDSGLGSSHSEGPSHIEDWYEIYLIHAYLFARNPNQRHVVDACSFFKSNSFLLANNDSNIERRRCYCFGRKLCGNRWQKISRIPLSCCCDNEACVKSSIATFNHQRYRLRSNTCLLTASDDWLSSSYPFGSTLTSNGNFTLKRLHQRELALVGLPIYEQKRQIIERVVAGVGEQIRGASTSVKTLVLLTALESLLVDGLLSTVQPWEVIRQLTGKGPVTVSIFLLCEELEFSEKPKNSLVSHFLQGLIALHSIDCWYSFSLNISFEHQLRKFYLDSSFLLGAHTSYRSLFARFVDCLELLSVLNRCNEGGSLPTRFRKGRPLVIASSLDVCERSNNSAAKLPSDSRVPKSSSLPSRIILNSNKDVVIVKDVNSSKSSKDNCKITHVVKEPLKRRSKIPVLSSRIKSDVSSYYLRVYHSRSSSRRSTPLRVCNVRESVVEETKAKKNGTLLDAHKGEQIGVLTVRGAYSRCVRLNSELVDRKLTLKNGVVPTDKLEFLQNY